MYTADKFTENGFDVRIVIDEDDNGPREWTHGCELTLSQRRYDLPNDADIDFDDFDGWQEMADYLKAEEGALLVLPVWGYEHGQLALKAGDRTGQFGDRWDSGLAGLAYVTPQNWKDTQGTEWAGDDNDLDIAARLIADDVDVYTQYLTGDVYGYIITDPVDGEEIDSLWSLYGLDYAIEEAKEAAQAAEHEPKCTGTLNHKTGDIEHTGTCPLHS